MRVLEQLEPKAVFHFFEDLTTIPRPSYHEKAVSDYLVHFARERGLAVYQDDLHNVVIIKEATAGYEDAEPIILQGHMDMVCEKAPGVKKDMLTEGLDLEIDGDWIRAKGTTLGGDDGIAVAYALALLDSETLRHPRLEFVCTVSEETGMEGAKGIDLSMLQGHLLLNIDSEEEGSVLAGCAGGGRANITLRVAHEPCPWERLQLTVQGLKGGHSGAEIHKGRAASPSLLSRVLNACALDTPIRLVSMENGTKDNAISREGRAVIAAAEPQRVAAIVEKEAAAIAAEYAAADPSIEVSCAAVCDTADVPLTQASTEAVLGLLSSLPQGVQRMSDHVPGLVETSLNWGIVTLRGDTFVLRAAVRSSVGTAYEALQQKLTFLARCFGAMNRRSGEYPAWEWVQESALRDKACAVFRDMYGKELKVGAIHAGVECGLLAAKIPHMDAISLGPDMADIHTPAERLSISSTARVWDFLVRVIETK